MDRLDYPDDHIEADNRLSWMLGSLGCRYPEARYIHLTRNPVEVASSFATRYPKRHGALERTKRAIKTLLWGNCGSISLAETYAHGIIVTARVLPNEERLQVFRAMTEIMTKNIEMFLRDRSYRRVGIGECKGRIEELWRWLGIEGDIEAAKAEFEIRHNATQDG